MVCFLVVFGVEDCVGGLPAIDDSPDNDGVGETVRSASNQGVVNEPVYRGPPGDSVDYVEHRDEDINAGKVAADAEQISSSEISPVKLCEKRTTKFSSVTDSENGNNLGEEPSGTDQCDPVLDKSKSRKDQATTATTDSISQGDVETRRVYDLENLEEIKFENKKETESKTDSSAYLTDVPAKVVSGKEIGLLSERTNVPGPEEESRISRDELPLENRQRKSLADVIKWQQSTNMRPTRTQYLVQNKRSTAEGSLKLPGNGGRRNFARNSRVHGPIRRQFDTSNHLEFPTLNPVQINAAVAYSNRRTPQQALNLDLSRALYQFGPAQLHALRGVFDKVPPSTQNFKPIAPKQVAYVPPRIVYETKIVPTPFMPFRTEQKTVDALSALLGQDPARQLQGLNMILRKDRPEEAQTTTSPGSVSTPEISRKSIHDVVALRQAFVTPIPSDDINSGLGGGSFRFSNGADPNDDIRPVIESPFDHKTPAYSENDEVSDNGFKTIPIVEHHEETPVVQDEPTAGWDDDNNQEHSSSESEGRYHQHNQESNHGVSSSTLTTHLLGHY